MRVRKLMAGAALLALAAVPAFAQHNHSHGDVGKVVFANSCAPAVQEDLMRGVAMLHSFWYSEGEKTFRAVLAADPSCSIANWGIASLAMNNPLAGVGSSPPEAARGQAALAAARATPAKTQRERDYVEAVGAYFDDFATRPEAARQQSRAKAYEALAARYATDDEAQIFSALYIAGTQSQSDQTFAAYARSAAILETQLAKTPDHPGISHYIIHVYDAPPLAAQGLTAARRYAGLAPDAPHALHMPSHIFTRVGAWEESATTNQRSFQAALAGNEPGEAYHASDYMVYADLQLGRDAAARTAMDNVLKIKPTVGSPPFVYAAAAMPARYAVEREDWRAAMTLAPVSGPPFTEALTWFARAIGAARVGDVAAAEANAAELTSRQKALAAAGNAYWAREVDIQQHTVAAWITFARKQPDEAIRQMREAADMEDRNEKHIISPGRILPARELLADMLLEAGQPAAALKEYEASQQREPNRFRGFAGAGRAAEAANERAKAVAQYGKLLAMTATADTARPSLAHAKAYVAR